MLKSCILLSMPMSSSVITVIAGISVGITLIVVMIFVGGSLDRYDATFYGDGGANVVLEDPGEDVDGCCDDVATIDLSVELNPSLRDDDQ